MTTPRTARIPLTALLLGLVLLGTAVPGRALSLGQEASFHLETITVEGNRRVTAEIVVAESLLEPGRVYRESELRDAVHRIQRLPFVLSAGFALRKGSERGRYELVIAIEEIRRYFFGEDLTVTRFTNSVAFDTFPGEDWTVSPGGLAGVRFFVGKYGVLFGSVAPTRGAQMGYTQYDLFGRRAFFSLGLTAGTCCSTRVFPLGIDPTFSSWQNEGDFRQTQLTFGLPLGAARSLRLQATHEYSEDGERRNLLGIDRPRGTIDYEDLTRNQVEVAWIHDTTDDPVFPTGGVAFTAALDVQWQEADLFVPLGADLFDPPVVLPPGFDAGDRLPSMKSRQLRLSATLAQTWRLSQRQFVTLSARLAAGRARVENLPVFESEIGDPGGGDLGRRVLGLHLVDDEDLDLLEGYFTAGYSLSLWDARRTRERGDLRWETTFEYGYDQVWPDLDLRDNPLFRKSLTTSLVFRNSWGVFRVSFQVADYGES